MTTTPAASRAVRPWLTSSPDKVELTTWGGTLLNEKIDPDWPTLEDCLTEIRAIAQRELEDGKRETLRRVDEIRADLGLPSRQLAERIRAALLAAGREIRQHVAAAQRLLAGVGSATQADFTLAPPEPLADISDPESTTPPTREDQP